VPSPRTLRLVPAVTVPIARLDPKVAPQICIKTGEAGQVLVPTTAIANPSWSWVLILAGGAPFFLFRRFVFARRPLELPARQVVFERREAFRRATAGIFAVIAVVLIWSIATLSIGATVLAITLSDAATAIWLFLLPTFWVNAELIGAAHDQVRLIGIHPHIARVF